MVWAIIIDLALIVFITRFFSIVDDEEDDSQNSQSFK